MQTRVESEIVSESGDHRGGILILENGLQFEGISFGYPECRAGEVIFNTGMVGYPETLTDASYAGQILVMTYPLVGCYGVADHTTWESEKIHVSGLVVSQYMDEAFHWRSTMTLSQWLYQEHIPALEIKDTRLLTQHIRKHGMMSGKIIFGQDIPFYDPLSTNLVATVSTREITYEGEGDTTIVLIDCGTKRQIKRCLLKRNVRLITVPWDYDLFADNRLSFDCIVISNGPGNPKMVDKTIRTIQSALAKQVPILGICLGHQLLALAAGGTTYKMKFGHHGQNQPCILEGSKRCYLTAQNHGFAVGALPDGFVPFFTNANDGSNEGMRHIEKPFISVQFHPEATPGPEDTEWLFDHFLQLVRN